MGIDITGMSNAAWVRGRHSDQLCEEEEHIPAGQYCRYLDGLKPRRGVTQPLPRRVLHGQKLGLDIGNIGCLQIGCGNDVQPAPLVPFCAA